MAGTSADLTLAFGYNAAGQITARTSSNDAYRWNGAVNIDRAYAVNGLNQYTQSGGVTPTYDARGNLTQGGGQSYVYNTRNQLFATGTAGQLFYRNPTGVLSQIRSGGGGVNLDYVGPYLTTEVDLSGQLNRRYVYGPGEDEPLVQYEGAGTTDRRYLHADERGSVIAVSDNGGTVTAINTYDEYGIPGAGNTGWFQYTGQKWISELGMYDYKARMYSPTLGRFLQTDPIGYADGMNWYNYVGSDPVNRTDPSGMIMVTFPNCVTIAGSSKDIDGGVVVTANQVVCNPVTLDLPDRFLAPPGEPIAVGDAAEPQNEQPPICTRGQVVAQAIGNRAMQVGRKATQLGDKAALAGTLTAAGGAALLNPGGVLVGGLVADAGVMVSVAGRLQIAGGAALSMLGGRSIRSTGAQVITDWLPFSDYYKDKADRAVNAALDFVGVPDRPRCRTQ